MTDTATSENAPSKNEWEDPRALSQRARRRVNDLVMQKYSDEDILAAVAEMGLDRGPGGIMLGEVKVQRVADKRKKAVRGMMIGAVWLVCGLAASIALWITMGMAGQMRIIWLAAGYGGYQIVSNLLAYRNAQP